MRSERTRDTMTEHPDTRRWAQISEQRVYASFVRPHPKQDTWGAQIRTFRRHRMLKQAALAAMLDVDQATVSRWERDIGTPPERVQRVLRAVVRTVKTRDQVLKHSIATSFSQVVLTDHDRTIWAASSSYCDAHGVTQTNIVGRSTQPQYTEAGQRLVFATDGLYAGEIASVRCAMRAHTFDGRRNVPVELLWVPVFLSDGTILKRSERVVLSEEDFARSPLVAKPVITPMSDIFCD